MSFIVVTIMCPLLPSYAFFSTTEHAAPRAARSEARSESCCFDSVQELSEDAARLPLFGPSSGETRTHPSAAAHTPRTSFPLGPEAAHQGERCASPRLRPKRLVLPRRAQQWQRRTQGRGPPRPRPHPWQDSRSRSRRRKRFAASSRGSPPLPRHARRARPADESDPLPPEIRRPMPRLSSQRCARSARRRHAPRCTQSRRSGGQTRRRLPLRRDSCRLPVEHVPGSEHVGLRRSRVAAREPQDVAPVEFRVGDEDLTRRVYARLQPLVLLVRTAPAKDDEREASRCNKFPLVALFHPVGEELGETDVLTNDRPQPFGAVAAQHGPQLERAE